jgi:hypothetical protein
MRDLMLADGAALHGWQRPDAPFPQHGHRREGPLTQSSSTHGGVQSSLLAGAILSMVVGHLSDASLPVPRASDSVHP